MNPAGAAAEDQALQYLQQAGLILVQRNYRSRFGEIDLIMRDGRTLVFIEVKARSGSGFGGSAHAITTAKIQRLTATAELYLASQHPTPPCRFDAVLVQGSRPARIDWLKNIIQI
ncbi:MAG: YraN family protein [Chitinivorax sp.]